MVKDLAKFANHKKRTPEKHFKATHKSRKEYVINQIGVYRCNVAKAVINESQMQQRKRGGEGGH